MHSATCSCRIRLASSQQNSSTCSSANCLSDLRFAEAVFRRLFRQTAHVLPARSNSNWFFIHLQLLHRCLSFAPDCRASRRRQCLFSRCRLLALCKQVQHVLRFDTKCTYARRKRLQVEQCCNLRFNINHGSTDTTRRRR